MKTNELTGAALDWAVAKCEGLLDDNNKLTYDADLCYDIKTVECLRLRFTPSTSWEQGGEIIEREKIRLDTSWNCKDGTWSARIDSVGGWWEGATPLVAAMRCYVVSKMGNTVDLPKDFDS